MVSLRLHHQLFSKEMYLTSDNLMPFSDMKTSPFVTTLSAMFNVQNELTFVSWKFCPACTYDSPVYAHFPRTSYTNCEARPAKRSLSDIGEFSHARYLSYIGRRPHRRATSNNAKGQSFPEPIRLQSSLASPLSDVLCCVIHMY